MQNFNSLDDCNIKIVENTTTYRTEQKQLEVTK